MEFVRQITDSSLLDKLNLPHNLRNQKIIIKTLPFKELRKKPNEDTETDMKNILNSDEFKKNLAEIEEGIYEIEDLVGIASKYARHDLTIDEIMKMESEAWGNAMVDKYGRHNS